MVECAFEFHHGATMTNFGRAWDVHLQLFGGQHFRCGCGRSRCFARGSTGPSACALSRTLNSPYRVLSSWRL